MAARGVALFGVLVLVPSLLAFAAPAAWWLDLLTHFRPHYALMLLLAALVQAVLGPRALAAAWGTGALLNAALVLPIYRSAGSVPVDGERVRIAHINLGHDGLNSDRLAQWLKTTRPALVSLQEVTPRNLPRLLAAVPEYRAVIAEARDDTRGVALLARDEQSVQAMILRPTPDQDRPMVQFAFEVDRLPVAALGFHTTRPTGGAIYASQAQAVNAAAVFAAAQRFAGQEVLLIGDFNSTPAGTLISHLQERADLVDARQGHGICATWPANVPAPLRIPIDLALHGERLVALDYAVGPDVGSDHLPILITLARRKGADIADPVPLTPIPQSGRRAEGSSGSSASPLPVETPATDPAGSRRE